MKDLVKEVANVVKVSEKQARVVLKLLAEKNTIPFIARYRKEVTDGLNEEQIFEINKVYEYKLNLEERKEQVLRLIDEKGLLTEQLRTQILKCEKMVDVEDLYQPFKEKKNTLATVAKNRGLEPLALRVLNFEEFAFFDAAKAFFNDDIKSVEDASNGVVHIIAEVIADRADLRKYLRNNATKEGMIVSTIKKNAQDEKQTYKMYYDFSERVLKVKPHHILAINRAVKEKVISAKLVVDVEKIHDYLAKKVIDKTTQNNDIWHLAIKDSYKRLLAPSIEREIFKELTVNAEEVSIKVFGENLSQILLQPPLTNVRVLGIDPAYRTGCKLVVVDETGDLLKVDKIFLHQNDDQKIAAYVKQYDIDVIAIGNGTASRETEQLVATIIKEHNLKTSYIIVNEAGASVYSASKIARDEFPNLAVEERSAVSIARRLQDPLAELVKIDPQSIGIGQYQHDLNQKKLGKELDFVVSSIVNQVGVDINSASEAILNHISGLNAKLSKNIVEYRRENGKITNRKAIAKIKGVGPKSYEQAIGFLRINDGENPLDKTSIHPENYALVTKLVQELNLDLNLIGTLEMEEALKSVDFAELCLKLSCSNYVLEDIILNLQKPLRDPREEIDKPILRQDVLSIEDLKLGMKLKGTVRNVLDFGAFVDIGIKNDGLVHISKLAKKFVKHPLDVVSIGEIVTVTIDEIDEKSGKVSLTMLD